MTGPNTLSRSPCTTEFGQQRTYDRTGAGMARDVNNEIQAATEDDKNAKSLKKEN